MLGTTVSAQAAEQAVRRMAGLLLEDREREAAAPQQTAMPQLTPGAAEAEAES